MTVQRFASIYILLSALFGLSFFTAGCGEGKSKQGGDSTGRGNLLPVEAIVIQLKPLENRIFTTGTLLANEEVELRSEISGRITEIRFEEGRRVSKGEVMLKINDGELRAQLKRKELEEKLATDEEHRKRNLHDINAISQEEYDKTLNQLRMIQAEREVILSQLDKTEITAPFDGVVGLRYVSEGGFVSPNMLAATMQDIDPVKVEFSVPEKYAGLLKAGTEITVRIGDSREQHRGAVYAVESKIDPGTRTIKTRATIPNSDGHLIPGSFARVEVALEKIPNAIVVPAEAIVPEVSGEKVFVCKAGRAKSVAVRAGLRMDKEIQILEGLNAADTLIVTGLLQLVDGKGVQIKSLRNN